LDEALAHKKWTIPPGALIELPYGPFKCCQAWEHESPFEVSFVFRNARGEYSLGSVLPSEHFAMLQAVEWYEPTDPRRLTARVAAKLVMAAIIRDFFVVEQREAVFGSRSNTGRGLPAQRVTGTPRVIYLPRVRYARARSPDLRHSAEVLGHAERRAHAVAAHLRVAQHASSAQLALAARYGFTVPEGRTFVRPHRRGDHEREIVYRSRSALQSLFEAVAAPDGEQGDQWFQFERDVQALLADLGFTVEHVAAPGRGDRGVDLIATKGRDLDAVSWVVQCKCYAPKHRVGPVVIRELVGALESAPRGSKGMVVTTSSFTHQARQVAVEHGIRLMDGAEVGERLRRLSR
jgi:hypothetical protein